VGDKEIPFELLFDSQKQGRMKQILASLPNQHKTRTHTLYENRAGNIKTVPKKSHPAVEG
jgi:hypothetical protein